MSLFNGIKACITHMRKGVTHGLLVDNKKERIGRFRILEHSIKGFLRTKNGEFMFEIGDCPIVSTTDRNISLAGDMGQNAFFSELAAHFSIFS